MALTSQTFFSFTALLLLLGFATLWLGYGCGWVALAGFVALVANVLVLLLSLVPGSAARAGVTPIIGAASLLTLQFGLVALYFGSFAWRTLRRARDLRELEILQSIAVFAIGLGGSMALVRVTGSYGTLVGIVTLGLAGFCYTASFMFMDRQLGSRRNFLFYSTVALVLTVVALQALLAGNARALTFALVSLAVAWIGSWKERATLSGHGAFFAVAAAVAAGLPQAAFRAFFGADPTSAASGNATMLVVIGVTMLNCWFDVAKHGRTWGRLSVVPKLVVLLVLFTSLGGLAVRALALGLGGQEGATPPDPAITAAVRTGVLALAALVLAGLSRWRRCLEAAWLVYPALILGGVKLLLEDLRQGRPATVFASLVLYGCALILAPRVARRLRSAAKRRDTASE
jgi:hypothetical protein